MPIYEYVCQACGQATDVMQKISDPPETDCPACGRPALQKLVSAAGFRLTGGGWYETDFKSGAKKNVTEDKPASTAAADTSSAAKTEVAKPAAAPTTT